MTTGGGTRLGMLMTAAARVVNEEGRRKRRGRKMAKLNQNRNPNPDLYQDRALDWTPTYLNPILLINPHRCRIVKRRVRRRGDLTQALERMGGRHSDKRGVVRIF